MTMRLDLSANPGADSIRDHIAELERELDAARARERHALVAGAEALRRIAAATPIGHEDVTKGPSTYTWLCYAASLLMAEAATTPATPLEQELITLRARAQRMREELAEIGAALNDPADNVTATTAQCITRLRAREAKIREAATALRIDANRLCDRNPYEEDCRRSIAALDAALGEDTPRPEVVEPSIQSVGQEPIKVVNLMEALRRSLDAVLRQDPNMQVRAVRYSAEDK